jgi:hypothetical protein
MDHSQTAPIAHVAPPASMVFDVPVTAASISATTPNTGEA